MSTSTDVASACDNCVADATLNAESNECECNAGRKLIGGDQVAIGFGSVNLVSSTGISFLLKCGGVENLSVGTTSATPTTPTTS
jgi:hypothetical protein